HRNTKVPMDSDLVIIGYGPKGYVQEFFAATASVHQEIPLAQALHREPEFRPDAKWYIYFVNRSYSHYVRAKEDHHWASPFRFLAQVGLQDLQYFGPSVATASATR